MKRTALSPVLSVVTALFFCANVALAIPPEADLLEDLTLDASPGPVSIYTVNLAYFSALPASTNVDLLISFWDNVDYTVADSSVVNTTQIGPTYRLPFTAVPTTTFITNTGNLTLTGGPLIVPDTTIGIVYSIVPHNGTTPSADVVPWFREVPLVDGGSNSFFGYDSDFNGVITGSDVLTWGDPDQNLANANLAIELETIASIPVFDNLPQFDDVEGRNFIGDFTIVPEPASLALVAVGALGLFARRRF